jgi:hypothetical protein
MAAKKVENPFKVGDFVKIRYSDVKRARIVELRGPLGPGGAEIYRVLVHRKPKRRYIEVRGDQLTLIPAEVQGGDGQANAAKGSA